MPTPPAIRDARPADWPAVAGWTFAHLREPFAGLRADRLVRLLVDGELSPAGLLVAMRDDTPVGGIAVQYLPGGTAVVMLPGGETEDIRDGLVAAAVALFPAAGISQGQAFVEPSNEDRAAVLVRLGFRPVTAVVQMAMELPAKALPTADPAVRFVPYSEGTASSIDSFRIPPHPPSEPSAPFGDLPHEGGGVGWPVISPLRNKEIRPTSPLVGEVGTANEVRKPGGGESTSIETPDRFAATLLATYRDSLDVPEANVGRPASDIIAGYRGGRADPSDWWLAERDGEAVGVLLLSAELPGATELAYLGVVPEARGQGVGGALLGHAIQRAMDAGHKSLTLTCDERNAPALRLYDGAGFRRQQRQLVYLWRANW